MSLSAVFTCLLNMHKDTRALPSRSCELPLYSNVKLLWKLWGFAMLKTELVHYELILENLYD